MEKKLVYIPITELHPHPDNPRKDLGDLTELAESIKVKGVMQNLTVVPRAEGAVRDNIDRKDALCKQMIAEMVKHTKDILADEIKATIRMTEPYNPDVDMFTPDWLIEGGYAV